MATKKAPAGQAVSTANAFAQIAALPPQTQLTQAQAALFLSVSVMHLENNA